MPFSQKILLWYAINKRALPWRNTHEPYNIWLSEIMLQQTRVAQGIPYYLKFLKNFPTVNDLASASEEKVLKLWQGLGYYSRARNLHETAKIIVEKYDGHFPDSHKELLKLKGVGDYTASAISSICFNEPEPVVDGNVYRVFSRYFGISMPINSTAGIKYFKELAYKLMNIENPRDYNQAIMEFGAIQCTPKKPDCIPCPLNESCLALKSNTIAELPVKLKKTKVRKRYFNYLVVINEAQKTLLRQRTGSGIWQNLYEFPLLETKGEVGLAYIQDNIVELLRIDCFDTIYKFNDKIIVHKLSHQHLHTNFWVVKTKDRLANGIELLNLDSYPVPVLVAEFIKAFKI